MSKSSDLLPISETLQPADEGELVSSVRACYGDDLAIYPIGGGTSLDFGLPPKKAGVGLSLNKMQRVIDYPARDMTVTIEAGMSMQGLADLLATNRQRLPIDVPNPALATIGGVIATNFNGPRRYGQGTIRDYVIGIRAVDGRGMTFNGGGRVVKNVAGYDFCKLLTGSLGTLGVITQVTLKLKPQPERLAMLVCAPPDEATAESALAGLVQSQTTPVAIELLAGAAWRGDPAWTEIASSTADVPFRLAVALEGTDPEIRWMIERLGKEWWDQGLAHKTLIDADAAQLMLRLAEFPSSASAANPMVLKASIAPSHVTRFFAAVRSVDPQCSMQSHAGNGIVILKLTQLPAGGVTKGLIGTVQSAAVAAQGTVVVFSNTLGETTQQSIWGPLSAPLSVLHSIKREFDPKNILNPDRFVYA